MSKKIKVDPKTPKIKKLMMTTQEMENLQAVHTADGLLRILGEAINFSLIIKRQAIKQRLSIESVIPGHSRIVNFDAEKGEVIIIDTPTEEPKKEEPKADSKPN